MAFDLLIKIGTMIGCGGARRRQADIAVKNGKIPEIGGISDGPTKSIDAADCVVTRGFVDPISRSSSTWALPCRC
jgi:predicted amidohydrolase